MNYSQGTSTLIGLSELEASVEAVGLVTKWREEHPTSKVFTTKTFPKEVGWTRFFYRTRLKYLILFCQVLLVITILLFGGRVASTSR